MSSDSVTVIVTIDLRGTIPNLTNQNFGEQRSKVTDLNNASLRYSSLN